MIGRRYLLDNNVLTQLTTEQRGSRFVSERCRVPGEVLHEARFLPDIELLRTFEYPTTARVLARLVEVMSRVRVGDFSLLDLYNNRGSADPLLVACALDAREEAEEGLFGYEWMVVTNDRAVRTICDEFGVGTLSSDELLQLLDRGKPEEA